MSNKIVSDKIMRNVIVYAPDYIQKEYRKAHDNPKIIHYAGFMKPWHNPTEDHEHYFWEVLRKTSYYEKMICRLMDKKQKSWILFSRENTGDSHKKNIFSRIISRNPE